MSGTIGERIAAHRLSNGDAPFVGFEYYPPKTEQGVENLIKRLPTFKEQQPLFVDFTWGAGGSTAETTVSISSTAQQLGLCTNMHLTCTNMTVEKVKFGLEGAKKAGIRNILALRGDPPAGQDKWVATEGGLECGRDLVEYIREHHGDHFHITVAAYPEGHPDVIKPVSELGRELTQTELGRLVHGDDGQQFVCSDEDYVKEMAYLKSKIDAGAHCIISQMFFDANVFLQFVKDCRGLGITCPILPGIMPISKLGGFERMTKLCKTRVPQDVRDKLNKARDDADLVREVGCEIMTSLCKQLLKAGTPGLHFYTLNLTKATFAILDKLDLLKKNPESEKQPLTPESATH